MNTLINKSKISAIAIVTMLLLMAFATLWAIPVSPVEAQLAAVQPVSGQLPTGVTVNVTVPTSAHLSFRPNPVGLGQVFLVNLWTSPGTHAERMHPDYTVTITKPDGTKDVIVMNSYNADATAWFEYIADQVGEWKIKFEFFGTYFPYGRYYNGYIVTNTSGSIIDAAYYKPSSTAEQTLTVQQDIVYSWPEQPLPTDYWTRPLTAYLNREWWTMAGNYPGTGYFNSHLPIWDELYPGTNPYEGPRYGFHPWVQGPNSAHIVWKRLDAIAGFTGPDLTLTTTGSATNPTLVYAGRAYATQTVRWYNGSWLSCAICYDLRTGEMYYMIPTAAPFNGITPSIIAYNIPAPNWVSTESAAAVPGAVHGSAPGETKVGSAELLSISGGYLRKIHPWTGALSGNYSIAPLTGSGGTYYMNQYALTVQDLGAAAGALRYRLINWTTAGTLANLTTSTGTRIISNTTYARSSLPTLYDYNVGMGATVSGITIAGAYAGITIQGFNLKTGESVWNVTVDETQYSGSCNVADNGKVAVLTQQGYYMAWDLHSGKLAWKSEKMDYPWDSSGFGAYAVQSAYGMIFRQAYSGVYAFDWETGKIVWKYKAPAFSPYETPFTDGAGGQTVYSFNSGGKIADGKMYVANSEHSATYPLSRGWGLHCINITTGELIWKIMHPMSSGVIADGYMTATDSNTGYMYVFGKGKSATTVQAPLTAIAQGQSVVITGTVTDLSAAQTGTPCVSEESMGAYMSYLHLQSQLPSNCTGVPVSIDAIDANGNYIHIATVTSDIAGTYSFMWKPDNVGKYTVTATFAGSPAYGSSWAETAIGVVEAAATATPVPTATPIAMPPFETYFATSTVAIIIAIAIVGLLVMRKMRKRTITKD